jgi:hypothetical protein
MFNSAFAVGVLGEEISWYHLFGSALIIVGVIGTNVRYHERQVGYQQELVHLFTYQMHKFSRIAGFRILARITDRIRDKGTVALTSLPLPIQNDTEAVSVFI